MFTTRPYTDADRQTVLALLVFFQEYERVMEPDWRAGTDMAPAYLDYLIVNYRCKNGELLIAEVDGIPIGYICYWAEMNQWRASQKELVVSDMYFSSEHRRKGYGKALIEKAMEYGSKIGHPRIILKVLAKNAPALALYEKMGFKPLEITLSQTVS